MNSDEAHKAALIWCPFPSLEQAELALNTLIAERFIACGNLMPDMRSVFVWGGTMEQSDECGALLKTSAIKLEAAMERLHTLHPYETPAITGWTVHASKGTLDWINAETEMVRGGG
ncbi:divalent-cation tolerance protein CutA [Qipengyuania sp. DGS5-3]|uniref:divalent-cation tolerance protein CutA n=1 Tax=Qipengyuania sp. DGS5-3 TaxID=3349632 RepID=UPI0036D3C91E